MLNFDIKPEDIESDIPSLKVPKPVKDRVVHIDADFLAYEVSYNDARPLADMQYNCKVRVEKLRLMAGAEKFVLHLTPTGSDKGGRIETALIKEYQGNRNDKPKPAMLNTVREWMHSELGAIMHMYGEADDGMSSAQYKAIDSGDGKRSVIATKDKDLLMVPGLMLDWDTGEISDTPTPFGNTYLDVSGKVKKVRGRGWKMFWAQMLMGDAADNVSGLPKCCDLQYLPNGKPKACGPVLTQEILGNITDNYRAFEVVRNLYKLYGEQFGFTNYRDGTPVSWQDAFISEAKLLWMRRNNDENDVMEWMKDHAILRN